MSNRLIVTLSIVFSFVAMCLAQANPCPAGSTLQLDVNGICACIEADGTTEDQPNDGCTLINNGDDTCSSVCISNGVELRRRRRRTQSSLKAVLSQCPRMMTACPINALADELQYECVSTLRDIDNCGGCVSTGEGISCSTIAHVKYASCNRGSCVVTSCKAGFKASKGMKECVPLL